MKTQRSWPTGSIGGPNLGPMTGPAYMHSCMSASMSASLYVQSAALMHECCRVCSADANRGCARKGCTHACAAQALAQQHAMCVHAEFVKCCRADAMGTAAGCMPCTALQTHVHGANVAPPQQQQRSCGRLSAAVGCGAATQSGTVRARAAQGQATGARGGAEVAGVHPSSAAGAHATTQTLGICT